MVPATSAWLGLLLLAPAQGPSQAQVAALVQEGAAFLKAHGRAAFCREVSSVHGRFHSGFGGRDPELYLFAYDQAGLCLAHGYAYKLVGMSRWDARDQIDGSLYVQAFIAEAQRRPQGAWVRYHFKNPKTSRFEPKHSFVVLVEGVVIGCGNYP